MNAVTWETFGPGRYVARCETAAQFLNPPPRRSACRESEYVGEADWRGSATYVEADAVIRAGWPEGARAAAAMAAKLDGVLAAAAQRETFQTAWDVAGDDADVARFLSGEPECMAASLPVAVEGAGSAVVRFAVKGGGSATVSGETFTRAAVLIGAAVDRMESAGKRVEVWVYYSAKFGGILCETWHLLKRPEEALDLPRLCAGLSPAAFRRVGWRWRESRPELKESHGYGISQVSEIPPEPGEVRLDAVQVGRVPAGGEADWLRQVGA